MDFDTNSGTGTVTITANTANVQSITINKSGLTVTTNGTATINTAGAMTLTAGTLNTNGSGCAWGSLVSTSGTRTLTLGASAIAVAGSWNFSAANSTLSSGTSAITLTGNATLTGDSGDTYYDVVYVLGGGVSNLSTDLTLHNLTITGPSSKASSWLVAATTTVTGVFTVTGDSLTNRVLVQSSVVGTARTIALSTTGTASLSNCDFMDITFTGTNTPVSGTSIGNALGNSGITFTGAVTRYGVVAGNWSNTATWSATDGGAGGASVPLPQDTVILNGNSAAGTYTADMPRLCADLTCTGFTRTLALTSTATRVHGSLTLASGMTFTQNQQLILRARSAATLTSAGKSFGAGLTLLVEGPGGTYTLQDALSSTGSLTLQAGTFNANGFGVSITTFGFANIGVARVLTMGSGTWTLSGTGTVWSIASMTNGTINANTSTILISDTSGTDKTFAGLGQTYNIVQVAMGGAGKVIFTGSNTFAQLARSGTGTKTINFTASTTTTLTGGTNAFFSGTAGNLITLDTDTGAGTFTVASPGNMVISDYLNLTRSVATGGPMLAGSHTTNGGSNTGWLFLDAIATGGLALMGVG